MKFVIASEDMAGLGFATRLQEEGNEVILAVSPARAVRESPRALAAYRLVGEGMVRLLAAELGGDRPIAEADVDSLGVKP